MQGWPSYSHFRIGPSKCQMKKESAPGHKNVMKTSSLKSSVEMTSKTLKIPFSGIWGHVDHTSIHGVVLQKVVIVISNALTTLNLAFGNTVCCVVSNSITEMHAELLMWVPPPQVTNSLQPASFRETDIICLLPSIIISSISGMNLPPPPQALSHKSFICQCIYLLYRVANVSLMRKCEGLCCQTRISDTHVFNCQSSIFHIAL